MRIGVAYLFVAIASVGSAFAQSAADDCARQAQDYANLTAPKSGGKVVRNSVNGVIVPGPVPDTTQLARGRDGSTVSGFARVDQYAPNREAHWIGQQRCQLQRR
jgi:hypothetical protein